MNKGTGQHHPCASANRRVPLTNMGRIGRKIQSCFPQIFNLDGVKDVSQGRTRRPLPVEGYDSDLHAP